MSLRARCCWKRKGEKLVSLNLEAFKWRRIRGVCQGAFVFGSAIFGVGGVVGFIVHFVWRVWMRV